MNYIGYVILASLPVLALIAILIKLKSFNESIEGAKLNGITWQTNLHILPKGSLKASKVAKDVLSEHYSARYAEEILNKVIVRIEGKHVPIVGLDLPSGYFDTGNRRTGTSLQISALPILSKKHYLIRLSQEGEDNSVLATAFFHELVQHVVSHDTEGNWNRAFHPVTKLHLNDDLNKLEKAMEARMKL